MNKAEHHHLLLGFLQNQNIIEQLKIMGIN